MFNGTYRIVGASVEDAQGGQYMNIIQDQSLNPAPVRIVIDSFNPATGAVGATVTMYSTSDALFEDNFHFILIEEDVAPADPEETHVTRALISNQISLTGAGNTAVFNESFTIDPTWDQANLRVVAFVQRQDKEIVQTASSYDQPDFSIRAMVPFQRSMIGPGGENYQSDDMTIMNVGQTDTFTISLVVDEAAPGWVVSFTDSVGGTHTDPLVFGLTEQEQTTFKVNVAPGSPGFMRYHFVVTSTNLEKDLEIPLVYITDDVEVLLVDDDGGNTYEDYFTAALQDAGISYGVWDLSSSKLNDAVAASMDLLIWNVGLGYPSLDPTDRAFVADHLDNGKSLFLSGQDIGWDLNYVDSGNTDVAFYEGYLHADYRSDAVAQRDVEGVASDPVSDGIFLHIEGGDGADNQDYPSWIEPIDSDAVKIFAYSGTGNGGAIRSVDSVSGAKIVYLAFGYEAIDNADDRAELMKSAIYWLKGILMRDGFETGDLSAWSSSTQ